MKSKQFYYNVFYCIVIPSVVSGSVAVGFFFYSFQMSLGLYPISLILFLTGGVSYLVGTLIRNNYVWKKETIKSSHKNS